MLIGGLQKFSLIDYPGKIAAVIFTQGCNFRCRYCHNSELVLPELFGEKISENDIFTFLQKRIEQLEGVVITGGEPTLHHDLPEFISKIKNLGYEIKLDTNGSHPTVLQKLFTLNLVDYVAMDVKAPLEKYCSVTGVYPDLHHILNSIELIQNSGVSYQFRTTVVDDLFSFTDLEGILELIDYDTNYTKQEFSPSEKILDSSLIPA